MNLAEIQPIEVIGFHQIDFSTLDELTLVVVADKVVQKPMIVGNTYVVPYKGFYETLNSIRGRRFSGAIFTDNFEHGYRDDAGGFIEMCQNQINVGGRCLVFFR